MSFKHASAVLGMSLFLLQQHPAVAEEPRLATFSQKAKATAWELVPTLGNASQVVLGGILSGAGSRARIPGVPGKTLGTALIFKGVGDLTVNASNILEIWARGIAPDASTLSGQIAFTTQVSRGFSRQEARRTAANVEVADSALTILGSAAGLSRLSSALNAVKGAKGVVRGSGSMSAFTGSSAHLRRLSIYEGTRNAKLLSQSELQADVAAWAVALPKASAALAK